MKDLSVQNVSMVYELPRGGSVQALQDVSFDLEAGRLLTLLGPSGCGKTTLLNIIAGFLAPTGGAVTLGGDPITGPGQERGMVFQQGALFEWQNVAQNVAFGPRMNHRKKSETKDLVDGLLNTVGLTSDPRKLKASAEFIDKREELLSMIWGMEEQIMGHEGGMS